MIILHYNVDTKNVSLDAFDPGRAEYTGPVGADGVQVIIEKGNAANGSTVMLTGQSVQLLFRDPANMGGGYLAGPFTLTQGTTADQGFTGFINTNSTPVQTAFKQTIAASPTAPEPLNYPALASIVLLPTDGSAGTESDNFAWNLTDNLYRTSTPPVDIVEQWDSPAQLNAAIAAAAAAEPKLPTPTANNQFLFGNTDGTKHFGAFPAGLAVSFSTVAASGAATLSSTLSVTGLTTLSGGVNITGTASATLFSGSGAGLTNLPAAQLTGTVPLGNLPAAVVGSSHYKGTWNASTNSPALTSGTGETGGYYLVNATGTTTLDGIGVWNVGDQVIFDGTRWDKIDGSTDPVATVDGASGDANGNVVLPSDQAANVGSKRTLGTGATQAAPGNDGRFSASVTGLRKGAGGGGSDTAAVPGTDYLTPTGDGSGLTGLAPFHPNSVAATYLNVASGIGSSTYSCTDVAGVISITFSASQSANTTVCHVAFGTAYTAAPRLVLFFKVGETASGSGTVGNLVASVDSGNGGLTIKADSSGLATGTLKYIYIIYV